MLLSMILEKMVGAGEPYFLLASSASRTSSLLEHRAGGGVRGAACSPRPGEGGRRRGRHRAKMAACVRRPLCLPRTLPALRSQRRVHAEAGVREAAYPPVLPSLTAKSKAARLRRIQEQVERIKAAPVEEKLRLISRIQREKFVVYPQTFARNADRWYQHFTKTAYIPGLPDRFTQGGEQAAGEQQSPPAAAAAAAGVEDEALADIRSLVTRVILNERLYEKKPRVFMYRRQEMTEGPFVRNLVTQLTHSLSRYNPLLLTSSLDRNPKVHFYWRRGQRNIPRGHRSGHQEPTRFQIDDNPHTQLRITQQLPQFAPMETSYSAEVPEITLPPNVMPLFRRQYDNHIFTGSKLPDPACYGHTQFHLVPDRFHRDRLIRQQQSDQVEVFLRANALASLFAWTGAQASYQGFWNHQDVTRPFASQAVITDGQYFSFFCYQLNTLALSVETDADNPRKNLLWGTESMRLYESVEDTQVVGLNDDVIKLLVRFLVNQP